MRQTPADISQNSPPYRRHLYGRSRGHKLPPRQARLMRARLPELQFLPFAAMPEKAFKKPPQKLVMEIGFGAGEYLAAMAAREPASGFIGCEPFLNGVAALLGRIETQQLTNIRIHHGDGRDVMEKLPSGCLAALYLLYPDPWPKRRHHKRRFINTENLAEIYRLLAPGGHFYMASDNADYIGWSLAHIRRHGGFAWPAKESGDWCHPWAGWQQTRYERKALRAGHLPTYLFFTRRPTLSPGRL